MIDNSANVTTVNPPVFGHAGILTESTSVLSTTEIKKRSISGAKWLVVMNGLGMPAAFLIAVMLGRVGPATLGVYALAQILIGVITTFVVYGGPPVLSVFMPKLADAEDRGRFVFSYLMILLVFMAAVLGLFWSFPRLLEFILQRRFDMRNYGWFVLLSLVIVATETFANAASGLMLIKITAIARQMMRLVLLPVVAILFIFRRDLLLEYAMPCLLGGFLVGFLIAAMISLIGILQDERFSLRLGWLLPRGFWAFSFSTMASTVFTFLYGNFDRMAVLGIQDVQGLGMYQAVVSLVLLVDVIPTMLTTAIVPMYSSLIGNGRQYHSLERAHSLVYRNGVLLMTFIALPLIAFSREALDIFGEGYSEYYYLLSLFCFTDVVRSPFFANTPYLISTERNWFRFGQSLCQIVLQIFATVLFMGTYGILAIAAAKAIARMLASIAGNIYVIDVLALQPRTPREYKAAVSVSLAAFILRVWVVPVGWSCSAILLLLTLLAFCLLAKVRFTEIRTTAALLIRRREIAGTA